MFWGFCIFFFFCCNWVSLPFLKGGDGAFVAVVIDVLPRSYAYFFSGDENLTACLLMDLFWLRMSSQLLMCVCFSLMNSRFIVETSLTYMLKFRPTFAESGVNVIIVCISNCFQDGRNVMG